MCKNNSWQIRDAYKHAEVCRNLIKEKIDGVATCTPFVPTVHQEANILTKGLFQANFEILASMLGIKS